MLTAIPWQPYLFVDSSTLAQLTTASMLRGRNIALNQERSPAGSYLSAWRSLQEQIYLWELFRSGKGNPASNPYTGQRNHLRGAAVDIVNKSDRPAMLAAGFTPDAGEWWHFNNPAWRTMPIITTNTGTDRNVTTIAGHRKESENMPYLVKTAQHGIYTVSPGVVVCHVDSKVVDGINFRDWGTVMEVAPDDLARFLFALGGCPATSIPAPGRVWYGKAEQN
jgi:hypothetical protein